MGKWRLRRSMQIAPAGAHWARLNLSRRGIGVRVGPRHAGLSIAADGSQLVTASIPNTGYSYTERLTASSPSSGPPLSVTPPPRRKFLGIGCLPLSLLAAGGFALLVVCSTLSRSPAAKDDQAIAPTFTATPVPAVAATVAPTETPLPHPTDTPLPAAPAANMPLPTPTAPPPTATSLPPNTPAPTIPPTPALVLEPTATPPVEVRSEAIVPLGATVNTANANLRGGPGTEYATVGSVTQGQGLEIVGRNEAGDWVQLAGGAWIAAFLVNDAPGDLPVVGAPVAAPVVAAPAANGGGAENAQAFTCIGGCATPPDPSCVIKGNVNSENQMIYHIPGGNWYDRTDIKPEEGDRWFCTAQEAVAAGFRAAKN